MFYSHEVLTSRRYGVATIWLVATLGAKSSLKKVNRKAIQDVDVPKACQTIITPDAPMALRLQSNLLYGVSRVYSQQCGYLLQDTQHIQSTMRTMLNLVSASSTLDPKAGKVRPDLLLLQDDPAFLPDLALPPLEFELDPYTSASSLGRSGSLSPPSSHTSVGNASFGQGLIIPSSDHNGPDMGQDPTLSAPRLGPTMLPRAEERDELSGFLPDIDFTFDAEGNLLELASDAPNQPIPQTPLRQGLGIGSDAGASSRVRREHEEGFQAATNFANVGESDMFLPGDDFNILLDEEALPATAKQGRRAAAEEKAQVNASEEEEEAAAAPLRKRTARVIEADRIQMLSSNVLIGWQNSYAENMEEAKRIKLQHQSLRIAKKNADYLVWGRGIGDVGRLIEGIQFETSHPLAMFAGDALFQSITGMSTQDVSSRKRSHESEDDSAEERRVRPRLDEEDEHARGSPGNRMRVEEDGFVQNFDDGEVEMPRDGALGQDDHPSSAMPWNLGSVRGSSVPRSALHFGGAVSTGGPNSAIGSMRHGSRLVSASPLHGRGGRNALESLVGATDMDHDDTSLGFYNNLDFETNIRGDDFQLYGPAAGVDTQTAAESQWTRETLNAEGSSFFLFVENSIAEKRDAAAAASVDPIDEKNPTDQILFEELIPYTANSRIVAAQALLHTLALATKGLLEVHQPVQFDSIIIKLTGSV